MKKNFTIIALAILAVVAIALPSPYTTHAVCTDCGQEYKTEDMAQMSGENQIVFVCKHCLD